MKKRLFYLLLLSTVSIQAQDISVIPLTFTSPDYHYLEIHLFVLGKSMDHRPVDGLQSQAVAEVLLLVRQDTNIVQYDKYLLNGPVTVEPINFVDVKRYRLPNGVYDLEIVVTDIVNPFKTKKFEQTITIDFQKDQLALSDIQLLENVHKDSVPSALTKNGLRMECLPFQFYTKNAKQLIFYTELYHSDTQIGEDYALHYRIENIYGNGKKRKLMEQTLRRKPGAIVPLLVQRNIEELPSGNYQLVVEIQNKERQVLTSKTVNFQNSKPNTSLLVRKEEAGRIESTFVSQLDSATLRYSLKAILPIIENSSVELINHTLRTKNQQAQRQQLYTFWFRQDKIDPSALYEQYMAVARAVDKTYKSGMGYGFESPRGYTFMRYGKPDDVTTVTDEPSAPPYEIWSYYQFPKTGQSNVKFLFYNPSLASGNFELLHSTARGELNNPQWEVELYRDDGQSMEGIDIDSKTVVGGVARRARQYFNDF